MGDAVVEDSAATIRGVRAVASEASAEEIPGAVAPLPIGENLVVYWCGKK